MKLYANDVLISQGDTQLTFSDLDGYAYKIPNKIRADIFTDPARINKLLSTMLNYKLVYNHVKKNNLIDFKLVDKNVDTKVSKLFAYDDDTNYLMRKEKMFKLIRNFLYIQECYEFYQKSIVNSIKEESIIEYAKERYLLNKKDYQINESRDIQYISMTYKDDNKDSQLAMINTIKNQLSDNTIDIEGVSNKYESELKNLIVSDVLSHFTYSNKQQEFSSFVFEPKDKGIIDGVLDISNQLLIVKILKITPKRIAEFTEVKTDILKGIKKNKANRIFTEKLLEISKDPVSINEENIRLLLTRYALNT
jgi:hypothetical protein